MGYGIWFMANSYPMCLVGYLPSHIQRALVQWSNKCSTLEPNKVNESSKLMQEMSIQSCKSSLKECFVNLLAFFSLLENITVECKLFWKKDMAIRLSILYKKCFGGILLGRLFLKINVSFLFPVTTVSVKIGCFDVNISWAVWKLHKCCWKPVGLFSSF